MTQLKLDLDSLTVESFAVEPRGEKEPGAVEAYVTAGSRTCIIPFCRSAELG